MERTSTRTPERERSIQAFNRALALTPVSARYQVVHDPNSKTPFLTQIDFNQPPAVISDEIKRLSDKYSRNDGQQIDFSIFTQKLDEARKDPLYPPCGPAKLNELLVFFDNFIIVDPEQTKAKRNIKYSNLNREHPAYSQLHAIFTLVLPFFLETDIQTRYALLTYLGMPKNSQYNIDCNQRPNDVVRDIFLGELPLTELEKIRSNIERLSLHMLGKPIEVTGSNYQTAVEALWNKMRYITSVDKRYAFFSQLGFPPGLVANIDMEGHPFEVALKALDRLNFWANGNTNYWKEISRILDSSQPHIAFLERDSLPLPEPPTYTAQAKNFDTLVKVLDKPLQTDLDGRLAFCESRLELTDKLYGIMLQGPSAVVARNLAPLIIDNGSVDKIIRSLYGPVDTYEPSI